MSRRDELQIALERYYVDCGWRVARHDDGSVRATGIGGITWIGLPVVAEDLSEEAFEQRLLELSEQRMPGGELCPLELLPDESCAADLLALLQRLRLAERAHVEIYSLAAASAA